MCSALHSSTECNHEKTHIYIALNCISMNGCPCHISFFIVSKVWGFPIYIRYFRLSHNHISQDGFLTDPNLALRVVSAYYTLIVLYAAAPFLV